MEDKKVIWITGASSGIGKALAIKFAENNWIVAASARRENLLDELKLINENIISTVPPNEEGLDPIIKKYRKSISMNKNPIVFVCANPDPEIKPELIEEVRSDAIVATGRSDYPNQVKMIFQCQ